MSSDFTPSPQQAAIFDWVRNGTGSALVVAVAGAGKTTTLVQAVKHMRGSVFLGAYNSAIAKELKGRIEGLLSVRAGTFHSAGFRAWMRVANRCVVEERKGAMIFDKLLADGRARDHEFTFALKLASLAKQSAVGVLWDGRDLGAWRDIVDHHDLAYDLAGADGSIEEGVVDRAIEAARNVVRESIKLNRDMIDYDDMIYAPLLHNVPMWPQDWVLIDEAQDTNAARRALAKKMLRPGGRLIAVGDPRQAIYGFTGADSDSMDIIKREFNCVELPLTVTYRCPKVVVSFVQRWVSHIQAHESAPEGVLRTIDTDTFMRSEGAGPGDVVLCRNVKPLVALAYALIREGRPCHVEGREIGKGLVALVNRWKIKTLAALVDRLTKFREKEVEKFKAAGKEAKAAAIDDKVETLLVIIERLQATGKRAVSDLIEFIGTLFADTDPNNPASTLVLSTVHKSKGREWDRVYLLGRTALMPSPWARQDWQMLQEDNLCYVAGTRSKRELVEVALLVPKNSVTPAPDKGRRKKDVATAA